MADINFGLLQTPNVVGNAFTAFQAGSKLAADRREQNALAGFATNPRGAINALAAVDPAKASQLSALYQDNQARDAREQAAPMIAAGKYSDAAKSMAAFDPKFAATLLDMDKAALDHAMKVGELGGGVMLGALSLPKEQRLPFALSHADEIRGAGLDPAQIQSFDWGNDGLVKATALRFLGAKDLATSVAAHKFGDGVYGVETNPFGATVNPKPLLTVPESRAERLDRSREDRRASEADRSYGLDRERVDIARTNAATPSNGDITAPVLAKVRAGEPLTEGEQRVWNYMSQSRQDPMTAEAMGSAPPAAVAAAPAPAPAAKAAPQAAGKGAGTRDNPHRPATPQAAQALPKGAYFLDPQGNLRQRQ